MAGPGGAEVGRVHIKVVPDFTQFRREMLEELKKWDGREVTIKVKADRSQLAGITKDLNRNAKQASKQMSNEVSKGIRQGIAKGGKDSVIAPSLDNKGRYRKRMQAAFDKLFNDLEVKLNISVADQSVRDSWDAQEKYIRKQLAKIKSDMGSADFVAQAKMLDKLLTSTNTKAGMQHGLWDTEAVKKYAAEVKDSTSKAVADNKKILDDWNYQLELAGHSTRKVGRLLREATAGDARQALREYVHGFRDLDGNVLKTVGSADKARMRGGIIGSVLGGAGAITGAKQLFSSVAEGIKNVGSSAGKAASSMGGLSKGLSPQGLGLNVSAAGFAVLAAAIGLLAAPLIGLLTTGLLALPGLLATVMAPIGAVVLGFGGIKKAAENAGLFGDSNGAKKGGGSLGAALKDLQTQVETVFEQTLTQPFKNLGNVADTWVTPLKSVAQGAADIMAGMVNSITSDGGAKKIGETFSAIGSELSKSFAPGIADFTSALINLAHQFTTGGALEGVGAWFKDTMAAFKEWTANTDLTTQFGNLGTTLKTILDTMGSMASEGLAFVGDQSKMDGFLETLKGVGSALENIVRISNDVGDAWNAIMPVFNIGQGIVDIMQGNGRDAWRNFKEAFGAGAEQDAPAMGVDFSKTIGAGLQAGLAIGNPFAALDAKSTEAVDKIAYDLAMAGTKGVEQLNQALSATDVETGVATQIQGKVAAAVTGATQALIPLKQGLQTDIDAALQPLGDIAGRIGTAFNGVNAAITGSLGKIPGQVGTSLAGVTVAAETSMAGLTTAVQQACDNALLAATFMAPKIIGPFEALGGQMAGLGADMMTGLGQGITQNVGVAKAAAETAAAEVLAAAKAAVRSKSPSKDFMDLGKDTQTGLAIGINNSSAGPISAIREVMQAIKDVFGSAEGLNLNFYMGQAATSMSDMATSSKEFRTNMVEAGTSPAISSGLDSGQVDLQDIKRQKAALDLRISELQAQKNATTDKAAKAGLQSEMDQLRIQKDRLDLLKEENGLQKDRQTAIQKLSDTIATNIVDMIKMPGEFAKSTANAAMQDIGISGSGALPTIANWALDAGTNFIFNVNNMDDAIQGQQAQQRAQTAGIAGR